MQIEHGHNLHRVFTFKRTGNIANRLLNKNIPGISVHEKHSTVECQDSQVEHSIVKAEYPLEHDHCLPYFEVSILGTATEDTINIGLIAKDNSNKQTIGKSNNSFGYYRGDLLLNKRKVGTISPTEKLKQNDFIGIGVNCHRNTFLVVKNGKVVNSSVPIPPTWTQFFPAVGVNNEGQKIHVIFNPKECKFNYFQMIKQIQAEIESDIKQQEINSSQIYPLVYQYLQFNGYNKSLQMRMIYFYQVRQKQKDFQRMPKLTKNPAILVPAINLEQKIYEKMVGEDEDMNQPLKFRHRIMSERIVADDDEIIREEVRRKNTQMVVEPQRKNSQLSNLSNLSNYNKSDDNFFCEEEEKQINGDGNTQNQKFLLKEKVEIVEHIKNKQIQKAVEIIQNTVPELLKQGCIVAFLKAHIFLRIVKTQSNMAGLRYSQQQKSTFENHTGTLFPFYNSQTDQVVWNPLKNIFNALAYNVNKNKQKQKFFDMLSDKQFHCFASYMNTIILKKMGYIGCSRLGICLNHSLKVLQKLKDYKGYTCGLELTL